MDTSSSKNSSVSTNTARDIKEGLFYQLGTEGAAAMALADGDLNKAKKIMQTAGMAEFLSSKKGLLTGGAAGVEALKSAVDEKIGTNFSGNDGHDPKEMLENGAILGGSFFLTYKGAKRHAQSRRSLRDSTNTPSSNAAPKNATSPNIDNMNPDDMKSSLSDIDNYNTKINETQKNFDAESKNLQKLKLSIGRE